jgi:hypothetical protein
MDASVKANVTFCANCLFARNLLLMWILSRYRSLLTEVRFSTQIITGLKEALKQRVKPDSKDGCRSSCLRVLMN